MKTTIEAPKKAAVQSKTATATTKKPAAAAKKAVGSTAKPTASKAKPEAKQGAVKAKANAAKGLKDFFEDGLKDIYWAEKALTKEIPKMIKNATSPDLVRAFESHLKETENHVARLEEVFASLKLKPAAVKCDAMAGLIEEAHGIEQETELGDVRDAALIAAAQKVEHYEIATYGTLRVYALTLGETTAVRLLTATLEEEKGADVKLTEIAVAHINADAVHEDHRSWFDILIGSNK